MNKLAAVINIGTSFFGEQHPFTELSSVGNVISLVLNIAFVASGVILLFFIILGGIGLISSAGKNNPEELEKGKKTVTSALIGFIVVFTAYWIVKLIGNVIGFTDILGP